MFSKRAKPWKQPAPALLLHRRPIIARRTRRLPISCRMRRPPSIRHARPTTLPREHKQRTARPAATCHLMASRSARRLTRLLWTRVGIVVQVAPGYSQPFGGGATIVDAVAGMLRPPWKADLPDY